MEANPLAHMTFMAFPPEVRNHIYNEILGPAGDSAVCAGNHHRFLSRHCGDRGSLRAELRHDYPWPKACHFIKPSVDLAILLVSKQIYTEAFHIFYSTNRFHFPDTQILYRFLRNIGYVRRQHLTMITFDWHGAEAKEAFRLLKTCRRLKSLHFTAPCTEPPGHAAIREIRGLEEAQVIGRVHHIRLPHCSYYRCRCYDRGYSQEYGPLADISELERAMMRPRLRRYALDPNETFELFKPRKREIFRKSEEQSLFEDEKTFLDHFN
ncbi:hypothetical protein N7G274_010838 [Stereocaulon virgatum]|uniref:DUF7730 domain-containing protein n=1 Tax=Stereocaulon virgatum TaxID=373712 RepID=A0ABR3ZWM7_9LECA